ncbi:MAG: tRNA1(Val) (adenine(37)-N6)-methyltransferase [Candidatus Bacteroides intestinipullorum]|uniref:tRNA1(Val) (adenine(37)-N6)-methyltransferase n=1 Tax=Candidatus Bacteroides intestinipullorum TaxID=2838471 RepID=A0A9E2KF47_9BACE|nr:tRNA1(Val) (adenine(37)-N6)-methyltransferase [Candidatus Bacteroides intestinipullorum]
MSNTYFKFKQFTIHHDRCAMKVGTDGVLLGAWASVRDARRILDVGTGSGLIAIQLAQRNPEARITAIEIDSDASGQAQENVSRSPWGDRIEVLCMDFGKYFPQEKFDLVVSNPPYFVDALRSPDAQRRMARHTEGLNYEMLFRHTRDLLAEEGRLAVILPTEVEELALGSAFAQGWFLARRTNVYTKPGKKCRRLLLELVRKPVAYAAADLFIERAEGGYSDEYIALTQDFYLYFPPGK